MSDEYFISEEEQERIASLDFTMPLLLRDMLKGFKWAIRKKNTSVVMIIDGRSGMGKSTLSFQVGKYCSGNFNLANVYFNPEQFLEGLRNAEPYSVHIFDEAMLLSNRSAMSQINRAAIQAMSMIRSKNIIVIFCINSLFDMDRNLVLSRADVLLHVYGDSLTDRGRFMAFFKGQDGIDKLKLLYFFGKKFYDYSKPKSNFNTTFSSKFVLDEGEDAYERKKQEGVNEFLIGGDRMTSNKIRDSRDNLIRYLIKEKGFNIDELAEISKVTTRTIYNILKE